MTTVRDWKQFIRMAAVMFVDLSLWVGIVYTLFYFIKNY